MAWLREAALVANRAFGQHCAALKLPAFYVQNAPAEANDLNGVARTALGLESNLELGQDGNAPDGATMAAALQMAARSRVLQQQLRNVVKPCTFALEPGPYMPAGEHQAYAPFVGVSLHYGELFNQQLLTTLLCPWQAQRCKPSGGRGPGQPPEPGSGVLGRAVPQAQQAVQGTPWRKVSLPTPAGSQPALQRRWRRIGSRFARRATWNPVLGKPWMG